MMFYALLAIFSTLAAAFIVVGATRIAPFIDSVYKEVTDQFADWLLAHDKIRNALPVGDHLLPKKVRRVSVYKDMMTEPLVSTGKRPWGW